MADRAPRLLRRLGRFFLVLLAVLVLAGAVLWQLLPTIVERMATDRLAAMGVPDPRLTVRRLGLHGAVISDVKLGAADEATAREIEVAYELPGLLDGRIDAVTLRGATLRAALDADGLSLGSLQPLIGGGPGGAAPTLPPIAIEESVLTLETPYGPLTVDAGGSVATTASGAEIALRLGATAESGEAAGDLTLKIASQDIAAELDLARLSLDLPDLAAAAASGRMSLRMTSGQLSEMTGKLRFDRIDIHDPRLAALESLAGSLSIAHGGAGWRAAADLTDATRATSLALRASSSDLALDAPVAIAADLTAQADSPLWTMARLPVPTIGTANLQIVTDLLPSAVASAIGEQTLSAFTGSVALELDRIEIPGLVESLSLVGAVDVESGDQEFRLTAPAPILADLAPAPELMARLAIPDAAAGRLLEALTLTLSLPEPLRIAPRDDGHDVAGTIDASVETGADAPLLRAAGSGAAFISGSGTFTYQLPVLNLNLTFPEGLSVPAGDVALTGSATGSMAPDAASADAEFRLTAAAPQAAAGGFTARDLTADLPIALAYDGRRLALRLTGPGQIAAARLSGPTPLTLQGPVRLPLLPGDATRASVDFSPEGVATAFDAAAGPARLSGSVGTERGPLDGELSIPRVSVSGRSAGADWSAVVRAADSTLAIPAHQLEATDIDLAVTLGAGKAPEIAVDTALAHRGAPAYVVPLTASIDAREVKSGWAFTGSAKDAFDRISLTMEGRHNVARGTGSATLKLAPIEFIPNVRQPVDYFPWLAGVAEDVSGSVALAGDISWDSEVVTSTLELAVRNLSATTAAASFDRINGVIAVDGLSPFTTPPGQQVAVAGIEAGLPLTDGLLTFRIAPGPKLEIAGGELHLAGGTVDVEPLTLDTAPGRRDAVLRVEGVDLGEMLALAGVDGLTGEGRMSGRIPVAVENNDVIITGGVLDSEAPGSLSYAPLSPPAALQGQGETVSLALAALTNFQYETLRLTVDRLAGGEMTVAMHVRGKNPDFYDGYPVEFNLNVSGQLDRVLRDSLAGYRVPDTIRERLNEFAQ